MNVSPRQTHSSFRRQVFPGRLKSHAVQTSSVTIDGGWNKTRRNLGIHWWQKYKLGGWDQQKLYDDADVQNKINI